MWGKTLTFRVWVVVMLVAVLAVFGVAQEHPVVTVAQGDIMGVEVNEYNLTHLQFLRIPYAQPPIGARRFKDPEPAGPWEGTLDASKHPPPCDQFLELGSEDCLFLSVYTPQEALVIDYPLPVMVFIHGGGYYMGSSRRINGFETFVKRGIIVVMIQYRLGVLGFLSTEDEAAPGNQGLKDQTLAIKWVKNNIAAFGGDHTKITLFGGSAGAVSIHYQMLAPSAAGLFSAAILQSGNALCPWGRGRDFLQTAQAIGERFGCPTLPTDALVSCLQTQDEHELDQSYLLFIVHPLSWL